MECRGGSEQREESERWRRKKEGKACQTDGRGGEQESGRKGLTETAWQPPKRDSNKTEGRDGGPRALLKEREIESKGGGKMQAGRDKGRAREGARGRLFTSIGTVLGAKALAGQQLGAVLVWPSCAVGQPCDFPLGLLLS